ncbi:MAG: YbjN domain-containing protein [Clostridia bacterium]|nr:YbjN domain-containing protein [Clostridia bacterium]
MVETAESFLEELRQKEWKYKEAHDLEDGKTHVACGVTGKTTQVDFHFFFDQDGKSVTIRIFKLFIAPIDKRLQIMELVNQSNCEYRWVKFTMDQDGWVNLQADAIINKETSGVICMELMLRFMNIIDTTYPKFMHEIWA